MKSKTEAKIALDEMVAAIRANRFDRRGLHASVEVVPAAAPSLTFREFAAVYKERHVEAKALSLAKTIDYRLKPFIEHFGDRPLDEIRTSDVDDLIAKMKAPRVIAGRERVLKPASINRAIQLLRHMFNWAVEREHIDRTPFTKGTRKLITLEEEDNVRKRRISEDEEQRLLAVAPPMLRSMMIAALDTGMRRGEMLELRFADIDWSGGVLVLRGETTKSGKGRQVPISTARLRAVLEWLRLDGNGDDKADDTVVFSDETGNPVGSFRRAWENAVLKAHGIKPVWVKGKPSGRKQRGWKELSAECKEAFVKIDLHWHDFRHEYASRLVDRGVPLSIVRDLLGHASIETTERYDNQTFQALQAAALRLETGKVFAAPSGTDVPTNFQESFKIDAERQSADAPVDEAESDVSACEGNGLQEWLGGRDSNPDNVVQSHVSYR
jgi:integrase